MRLPPFGFGRGRGGARRRPPRPRRCVLPRVHGLKAGHNSGLDGVPAGSVWFRGHTPTTNHDDHRSRLRRYSVPAPQAQRPAPDEFHAVGVAARSAAMSVWPGGRRFRTGVSAPKARSEPLCVPSNPRSARAGLPPAATALRPPAAAARLLRSPVGRRPPPFQVFFRRQAGPSPPSTPPEDPGDPPSPRHPVVPFGPTGRPRSDCALDRLQGLGGGWPFQVPRAVACRPVSSPIRFGSDASSALHFPRGGVLWPSRMISGGSVWSRR